MQKTKIKNNNTKKKTYVHIWILNTTTTTTSSGAATITKTTTATVAVVSAAITTTLRRTPRTHQILYIPHCCILFTYIRMPNKNSARVPIYILCAVRTGNGTTFLMGEKKRSSTVFSNAREWFQARITFDCRLQMCAECYHYHESC